MRSSPCALPAQQFLLLHPRRGAGARARGGGEGDRQWVCRPETGLTGPGDQEGAVVRGASGLGPEGCVLGCTQGWEEGAGPADAIECPQGRGTASQAPTNSLSLLFPF